MLYCANCGNAIQNDALFCPECGTKSESSIESLTVESAKPSDRAQAEEPPPINIKPAPVLVEPPGKPKQFCRNCGNEVDPGAFACLGCGLPPMKAFNFCPGCGANCHQEAIICIKCGISLESQENAQKISKPSAPQKAYCRNCGKEVLKGSVACLNCGLPPGKSKNFCPSCGSETHNDAVICIKCGSGLESFASSVQSPITQPVAANPVSTTSNNVVVVGQQKSVGTAFLLAFLFGPLGLLYASVPGGIIMFLVGIFLFFLIPVAGGFIAWIICIIWAIAAAQNSNESALKQAGNIANNMNRQ